MRSDSEAGISEVEAIYERITEHIVLLELAFINAGAWLGLGG
jgi:hypothetical protein